MSASGRTGAGIAIGALVLIMLLGIGASAGWRSDAPEPEPPPAGPPLTVWLGRGPKFWAAASGIREQRVELSHDEVFDAMRIANLRGPVHVVLQGDVLNGEWWSFQRELDAQGIRYTGGPAA